MSHTIANLALVRLHGLTTDLRQILKELRLAEIDPNQKRGLKNHLTQIRDEVDEFLKHNR